MDERPHDDPSQAGVEGEGSYSGTKDYNERTKQFVESGQVEKASRDAEPKSEKEKRELREAERIGKARSKGEDPELRKGT